MDINEFKKIQSDDRIIVKIQSNVEEAFKQHKSAINSLLSTNKFTKYRTIYTSNATFEKKYRNPVYIEVMLIGGGGGGAGAPSTGVGQACEGGAGGGGGCSFKIILGENLNSIENIVVGGAGTGGAAGQNNGGDGGSSIFGNHFSASGGKGGLAIPSTSGTNISGGGDGGVGNNGDLNLFGGPGGNGYVSAGLPFRQNRGGSSFLAPLSIAGSGTGFSGVLYGGGGSGASIFALNSAQPGGPGATGIIIVDEYM